MSALYKQSMRHESNLMVDYVLVVHGDAALEVTNLFEALIIEEDMEKGFIYGSLTFLDNILLSRDAFDGSEYVEVSFRSADDKFQPFEPYIKRFKVNRYETILQSETGTVRAMKLHFVSEPAVKNDSIKLMRTYTNTSNSAFVNQCCDLLGVDDKRFIEETLHAKHFVAPNISPLDMINWIKTTSQSKANNGSDFYFFENRDGVHFKCMESIKLEEPKHNLFYKPNVDNYTYNIITKFEKPKGYDIQDDYRYGGIGCTLYTHDLTTKRYVTHRLEPSAIQTLNPASPKSIDYPVSTSAYSQFWPHNNAYSTLDLNSTNHSALIRSVSKTMMNFKSISVEIAGNVDIKTGDVVNVSIPDYEGIQRIDEAGKWVVKKLRHLINRANFYTQLELVSDSNTELSDDRVVEEKNDTEKVEGV